MKEPRDAYKVLQVDPEADLDVINAAYRRLAQKYHPDRAVAADDDFEAAAERMVEINAAWDQLREPTRRAEYDHRRRRAASNQQATTRHEDPAPSSTAHSAPRPQPPRGGFETPGSAGPPPGRPSGSVLNFGRYSGWSLGEVSRADPSYLEWLDRMPIGRPFRQELDMILRRLGRRGSESAEAAERRGLFRQR